MPLRPIDLPITFGDPSNYRTKTLTFEVVGFHGTYHAILGHPWYAKFMVIPNYTYLKLKMLGPCGVITIGTSFQLAYECEVECYKRAAAIVASKEPMAIRKEVTDEAPNPKRSAGSFEPVEGAKGGPHRPQRLQGQSGTHWHHDFLRIGKRARRLPPRQ
ncbi:uncharacterized protein [Miscanthus floridulus]|uniref:uncharacterized protein n=1 Tax=Miscanthus floridulus TaxID=154761 RepID=UPI003459E81A